MDVSCGFATINHAKKASSFFHFVDFAESDLGKNQFRTRARLDNLEFRIIEWNVKLEFVRCAVYSEGKKFAQLFSQQQKLET